MQAYLAKRQRLIAEDRAKRVDCASSQILSVEERKADAILRRIRQEEATSVWGEDIKAEILHGSQQLFPGMEFLTARETILRTKVYDILSHMPKGGLLHLHLGMTVGAEKLMQLALVYPAIHVRVSAPITKEASGAVLPQFQALPEDEWTTNPSLTDPSYELNSWVSVQNARRNFCQALGGPEGFDRWVNNAMTINPSEAYGTHNTPSKIWRKFIDTSTVAEGIIYYLPLWKDYIREVLLSSFEDGISYVEPRFSFSSKFMIGPDGKKNVPHREWLKAYEQVIDEVKEKMKKCGRGDEFFGSKIIYTAMRFVTTDELEWYLEDCLALKQEFPHLVAGFDLVGHEDSLKPLIDYAESFIKFIERQKELEIYVPFIFHAGETLGDGTKADMNLYDAILLGTKRIGHGFSLIKHPRLMELCKEQQICVEVCPISNEILRLVGSMPMHPLPALMNQGVHVALCSDDPAVFGNMGLSFDFFQVFVASEVHGLSTLRELVWDSIRYSNLDEEEKEKGLVVLEKQWRRFVEYILKTYSDDS